MYWYVNVFYVCGNKIIFIDISAVCSKETIRSQCSTNNWINVNCKRSCGTCGGGKEFLSGTKFTFELSFNRNLSETNRTTKGSLRR